MVGSAVRLTVPRGYDSLVLVEALENRYIGFFPQVSDEEPEPILQIDGQRYIGEKDILSAIAVYRPDQQ